MREFSSCRPSELLNSRETGFEAFYCEPGLAGAHEKGGVEGEIGRFRRRWFVPVPRAASLAELNARLAEADAAEDARHIEHRAATVGEDFAAEAPLLLPLPSEAFDTAAALWPRVDRYARIAVGKCRYSVPARLIDSRVRVRLSANQLERLRRVAAGRGPSAADRGRGRAPGAGSLPGDLVPQAGRAARRGRAGPGPRQRRVHRRPPGVLGRARARLGDGAGTRALIEVLLLHRRMPAAQVIAGITAALEAGSCSPDVVAIEARKHAGRPAPARPAKIPGRRCARGRRGRQWSPCPGARHALPADQRPAPSVAAYDQLLTVPPAASTGSA